MMQKLSVDTLQKAVATLESSYKLWQGEAEGNVKVAFADSCIKRFEYTVEVARKLMSKFLQSEYGKNKEELKTKNVFRFMQGYGLISDWERWSDYIEKRNDTSHEYDEEKAAEIIKIIPAVIEDVKALLVELRKAGCEE